MTARFEIRGRSYIAIAAIPYVTGGFFTLGNIADMIANYESFCDYRHHTVLSPLGIAADGKLVRVDHRSFIPVADAWAQGGEVPQEWSVPGLVVPEGELRTLMDTLVTELAAAGNLEATRPPACWNPDAVLPASVQKEINEHIRKPLNRTLARKNSMESTRERIGVAMSVIVETAARHGVVLDIRNVPGHKEDFIRLLRHVDSTIAIADSTLDSHYFPVLGLRWRRGARREAAARLLAAFGLRIRSKE